MKTSKKSGRNQRVMMERKTNLWLPLRSDRVPPFGWLKAIRGALGISTRQLAERLGVKHAAIVQFEKREAEGSASLHSVQKVAKAMRCKFIYAIVPEEPFANLDAILSDQALRAARAIVAKVDHTMRLEQQGLSPDRSAEQVKELAEKIKSEMSRTLWGKESK